MADSINSNADCQQRTGVIYMLKNEVNGKCYVGQTIQKLSHRLSQHKYGNEQLVDKAIQKYGWENFSVEVLADNVQLDELDTLEIYWIAEKNSMSPNGYNLTSGGSTNKIVAEEVIAHISSQLKGRTLTDDHKTKLSEIHSGEKNPFYGKKHTDESRAKMSESRTGEKNPMYGRKGENNPHYGKHHTPEACAKISAANKGKPKSEEHKAKLSVSLTGKMAGENNPNHGKHHTEETRAKMREAWKRRKEASCTN